MERITPAGALSPLVLTLDVGSTSLRAGVIDAGGRAVDGLASSAPTPIRAGRAGENTADPAQIKDTLFARIDETLLAAGELASRIEAVCGCSFVSNLMAVDKAGQPLTPLTTYADASAAKEAALLKQSLDEEAARQRTGCRFHPSYCAPRLLALKNRQPEVFKRADRFITLGEYLELTLFGRARASFSAASWSGLTDIANLCWDRPILDHLGIGEERFSPLADIDEPLSGLRAPFARRWPALAQIPWFPMMGDGAAANVGKGCVRPERVAVTIGTSSAVRAVVSGAAGILPPALWRYRLDRHHTLPGGALTEGGSIPAWMRRTLNLSHSTPEVERQLSRMPACGHGLTMLPLFAGERAPGWSGAACGAIVGITHATTPADILLAGMESVAQRLHMVLEELAGLLPVDFTVAAGGGALGASRQWRRILTDALGREVHFPDVEEPSMRGAALMALKALGAVPDIAALPAPPGETLRPDVAAHAIHLEAMARQRRLYEKLVASP
jgi:gluconokinase